MRRPVRLASWLAVGLGALLVAGPIAAPALAGHASMAAAGSRRNGNDHSHSTAKAWKTRERVSERRPAKSCAKATKAWKKGSVRRPAQQCATVSPGSGVRTAPVLRQTAQPTTTAGPPTTTAPTTTAPTTTAPRTTICEPATGPGGGQLPSTGSSPAHLLIAGLLLGGGLTILVGVRSRAAQRGAK
jgi:LPXTG-motif cell wall-anchored protein